MDDFEDSSVEVDEAFTVASLAQFVQDTCGDDDDLKSWARERWKGENIPTSPPDVEVDRAASMRFMSGLVAEQGRRDVKKEAAEEDTAMTVDQARLRLLAACGGQEELAEKFVKMHVLPAAKFGMVLTSLVNTLCSQVALSSIDLTPTPSLPPVKAAPDYDHVTITTAASSLEPMMARYEMAAEFPGAGREPTGFARFDEQIALKPSTVTVIAGREGAGKSAFMLQAAASMSVRGPVIYVITEMSQEDVWKRQTACFGQLDKWKLDRPNSDTVDAARVTHEWMAANMQLHVVDAAGVSLNDYTDRNGKKQPGLITIVSNLAASLGGVRAVFIDNLWGLAHASGQLSKMSMSIALGSITKTLRECAASTMWDCPIVLAHHLNREGAPTSIAKGKDSGVTGPATENLGGSDQIGFDAEAVILLSKRPAEARELDEQAFANGNMAKAMGDYDVVDVHITKNRNGRPNTTIVSHFYGAQQRFVEVGMSDAPPLTVTVSRDTRRDDAARSRRHSLPPL